MAVLGGTIARLQGLQLRGLPTLETLAADLQRARRALKQALIQAGGVLEWRARGAHHRRRRLEQRASSFAVFPGSVRPLSTTWPWTIRPALAVLWGVCWQFYASGSFGSTGGDGGLALADAGSAGRVRAARLEWQLDLGWQGPRDGACEFSRAFSVARMRGWLGGWVPEAQRLRALRPASAGRVCWQRERGSACGLAC